VSAKPRAGRRRRRSGAAATVLVLAAGLFAAPTAGRELGPGAARGKRIYTTGTSSGGAEIEALVAGGVRLSASVFPCVQCHGIDGRGGLEGGVMVPEIRWDRLSSPHGVPTYLGGLRPPYDERTAKRAIRDGRDSAGEPLNRLMPRYSIGDADLADLLAYLRELGSEDPAGVTGDRVRVGLLLPRDGPAAEQSGGVAELLARQLERVNAGGGIHGRRIELVTRRISADGDSAIAAARQLIEGPEAVFCFLANAGPGAGPEVLRILEESELPVVGPLAFARGVPGHGSVFYLLASLEDQARAAARFLATETAAVDEPVALVHAPERGAREMAGGFSHEAGGLGLQLLAAEEWLPADAAPMVGRARAAGVRILVFFGPADAGQRLAEEAVRQGWRPDMVASGVLLAGHLRPPGHRLFLISPAVAPSAGDAGFEEFATLRRPGAGSQAMEMAAFAAAKVLTESLEIAGRELSRDRLLEELRDLRDFRTGVMPPISFGPNQRVGARGGLIATIDETGRIVGSDWVEVGNSE
jgi:ABC-type branched-subunit amino acid transport system substrate-binding protein